MKLPEYPSRGTPVSALWGKQVVDYLKALTGQTSATVRVSMTTGGSTYETRKKAGGAAVVEAHPYKIYTRTKPDSDGVTQARVEYHSGLMRTRRWDDTMSVVGLSNLDADGKVLDESWFDLIATDAIWLEYRRPPTGDPTANIRSWGKEDEWNNWPTEAEVTTAGNYYARYLIAYTVADKDGKPELTQCLYDNLLLVNACFGGTSILFPQPYSRGYRVP